MLENETYFASNVYTASELCSVLLDTLTLPDSVAASLHSVISVCEPYIDGFEFRRD